MLLKLTEIEKLEKENLNLGPWNLKSNYQNYHWNNRIKLIKDYKYILKIKNKIFKKLVNDLNYIHKKKFSYNFWEIILEPFVSNFISVYFDRWETIRLIKKNYYYNYYNFNKQKSLFNNFYDFAILTNTDKWNQYIFQKIIFAQNKKNLQINLKKKKFFHKFKKVKKSTKFDYLIIYFLRFILKRKKKVIVDSYFNFENNIKLGLYFKFKKIFDEGQFNINKLNKNKINNYYKRDYLFKKNNFSDKFEKTLADELKICLPHHVMENFDYFIERIKNIKIKSNFVISTTLHHYNIIFKIWSALQTLNKKKIIFLEHGGSLPAPDALLGFQEKVPNKFITFHKGFHPNHKQLPAHTLLNIKKMKKNTKENLILFANRVRRYSERIEYYPLCGNNQKLIDQSKVFLINLEDRIKKKTFLKMHPGDFDLIWNNIKTYKKIFSNKVYTKQGVQRYIKNTKLAVCLYPETTFGECLSYDVPTIMVYDHKIYERHKNFSKVINKLKSANILFYDHKKAAKHVNKIWSDPEIWWSLKKTQEAIILFKKEILGITNYKKDLSKWRDFLKHYI